MYSTILHLHNGLRWLILLSGVWCLFLLYSALIKTPANRAAARRSLLIYTITLDLQLLVGLTIYFFFSSETKVAFADLAAAMKNHETRQFAVEHPLMMILAIVLAHIANVIFKRSATDSTRYRRTALYVTSSLLLILLAVPWQRAFF